MPEVPGLEDGDLEEREEAIKILAESIVSTMREQARWLQDLKRARLAVSIENETGEPLEIEIVRDEKTKEVRLGVDQSHSFDTFERQQWRLVVKKPTSESS